MRRVHGLATGMLLLTTGLLAVQAQQTPPSPLLIVAGQRAGTLQMGMSQQEAWKQLGKPTTAGKGVKYREDVWKHGAEKLVVNFRQTNPDDPFLVNSVQITSPTFHTRDGIGVGSTWTAIHRCLPGVQRNLRVEPVPVGKGLCYEYRDDKAGILFHIQRAKDAPEGEGRCTLINVYKPF